VLPDRMSNFITRAALPYASSFECMGSATEGEFRKRSEKKSQWEQKERHPLEVNQKDFLSTRQGWPSRVGIHV